MKFLPSLGSSILACRYADSPKQRAASRKALAHEIFAVVSGGRIAREYIEKVRALGASQPDDYSLVLELWDESGCLSVVCCPSITSFEPGGASGLKNKTDV